MLNRISRKISTFQIMLYIALVTGSVTPAMAAGNSTVKLPTPDDSFLKKIVNWMQSILDLVGGAGALFFAFVSGFACIVGTCTATEPGYRETVSCCCCSNCSV